MKTMDEAKQELKAFHDAWYDVMTTQDVLVDFDGETLLFKKGNFELQIEVVGVDDVFTSFDGTLEAPVNAVDFRESAWATAPSVVAVLRDLRSSYEDALKSVV
jgi:hypothetical protein